MFDTLYHFVNDYPYVIFILFTVICLLQYKYKITGLIVSVVALLSGFLLYYTDQYSPEALIKIYLVTITAAIVFYKLNFKWGVNVNYLVTFLLAMNVFVLIFSVIKNPFAHNYITNYFLVFCFLLVTLSTPLGNISKNNASFTKIFTNVNIYVILYTVAIGYYFMINPNFKEHLYLNMFAIILPFISHFTNNRWIETRGLCLCLLFIYDLIDKNNYAL